MTRVIALGVLAALAGACQPTAPPPLTVHEPTVYAPLPGQDASVAYFTLENPTGADLVVERVSSPQFAAVAIHETRIVDGVARMVTRDALVVPAAAALPLAEGGLHVMLEDPVDPLPVGTPIVLRVHVEGHGAIDVRTLLTPRIARARDE